MSRVASPRVHRAVSPAVHRRLVRVRVRLSSRVVVLPLVLAVSRRVFLVLVRVVVQAASRVWFHPVLHLASRAVVRVVVRAGSRLVSRLVVLAVSRRVFLVLVLAGCRRHGPAVNRLRVLLVSRQRSRVGVRPVSPAGSRLVVRVVSRRVVLALVPARCRLPVRAGSRLAGPVESRVWCPVAPRRRFRPACHRPGRAHDLVGSLQESLLVSLLVRRQVSRPRRRQDGRRPHPLHWARTWFLPSLIA